MNTRLPAPFNKLVKLIHDSQRTYPVLLAIALLQACRMQPADDVQPTPVADGKPADQYTGDVATKWAALQLKLTKTTAGFTPPVASRAYGYAGIAMFTWNC